MFACLYAPGNLPLLVECAGHFSPLIEETSSDTVVFDIRGLQRIYGSAEQIASEIQRRVGITANLALASNPDAAIHAAQAIRGVTILPPDRAAAILAPLPPYLLGGSPEFARTLDLWGVRTFGEFADLPHLGVAARLGEEGTYMQQLARGAGHRQLRLRVDPVVFRQQQELEDSVDQLEPLLFLLSRMLNELCERLRFYGRSTNEIRLRLKLERAPGHTTTLRLPVPMLDARVLLKLLQLELNDRPPQAPIEKIQLELMPVEPRTTQHGLFLPSSPEPEKLEITLARIRGMVGAENVGAAELMDTHRPDAFRVGPLVAAKGMVVPAPPKLAFRRFRPPCPAQVWCADQGKPARIVSSKGGGRIVACAGPWRTSGDWWASEIWSHQEWDVETQSMGVSRIYHDYLQGEWFIEGNYD
ncbi:MAG: nucleotidyltransferase/DNA polymerase involved in repair-like protein [Bryobacterales bacterium]|nr:nucleotidyltransferase/DNA polymerase involved in repair-like protein [Bryobacterales bacterium]